MKISSERKRLEEKNKKDEAKVMSLVAEVIEERTRHEELQREHNRVLMQQVCTVNCFVKMLIHD
jgi:uncharacterized metal-binding protein